MKRLLTPIAVAAAFILLASSARGAILFQYDFENLNVGALNPNGTGPSTIPVGQDGWKVTGNYPNHTQNTDNFRGWDVVASADTENQTKVAKIRVGTSIAWRPFDSPIKFTNADTQVEFSVWVKISRTASAGGNAWIGLEWEGIGASWNGTYYLAPGSPFNTSGIGATQLRFMDMVNNNTLGAAALDRPDWYEIKGVMDFSTPGGRITMLYRNVTDGQTTFTQDATLTNLAMNLTPNGNGEYVANGVKIRGNDSSLLVFVDNLRIEAIPEPSSSVAFALMTGLCVALRRRRNAT